MSEMKDRLLKLFLEIELHLMQDTKPSIYLREAYDSSLFQQYPFNMLYRLKSTEQSPKYHPEGNVWNHTMLVVDEAAKMKGKSKNPRVFMWAALLHDVGKAATTKTRRGRITSYNHDRAGAMLAREFLLQFMENQEEMDEICGLVRYHMQILFVVKGLRFADIAGMKYHTDIHEIALLGLCDRLGRHNINPEEEEKNIRIFLQECESFTAN